MTTIHFKNDDNYLIGNLELLWKTIYLESFIIKN